VLPVVVALLRRSQGSEPKAGRLLAAISAGRGGRREIPLCAARPFAGAKGKKKSGGSVRNDGRGGSGKGEERCGVPFPYRAGTLG
jgi:hypothetical protein